MDISEFIRKLEPEFEELVPGTLKPETSFRNLKEWNSMHALIIIALIDSEYDVTIGGEDLKSASTVQDLFNIILKKKF